MAEFHSFSRLIHLGGSHLSVSNRRRVERRRARSLRMGHLRPAARGHRRQQHRRRRRRFLPPVQGRYPHYVQPGAASLSLLDRLAANSAPGHRSGQPGRAGFLRPAGRCPAGKRHPPAADPAPLGSAAGPARPGRLGPPGDRRSLCRTGRPHGQTIGRPHR